MSPAARHLQLVAHRGNAFEFPENTVPALISAIELGVRYIEFDVQLSRDAVPMVIHDHELARTAGIAGSIFDMRASELVRLEVCEKRRFGNRFRGTHMPRLADAIGVLENRPNVTAFVEIKRQSLARFGHEMVLGKVLETLRPFRTQCVVVSFDLPAVFHARLTGGHRIGWVLPAYDDHARLKYEALQPEFLFCDVGQLPGSGALWRGPWRWVIYEIATLAHALQLAERGAYLIETMHVRSMTEALSAHASASVSSR
jgi:glycerophosphoryl diester phosphodiesterase